MKHFICLLLAVLIVNCGYAQKQPQYSRARINLDATHTLSMLSGLGLAVDHGEYKKNTWFTSDFSEAEIAKAKSAGFKVDIVIADVAKHYREQNKKKEEKTTSVSCNNPSVPVPAHFHLGSYAGYFTYDEMLTILDSMQLLYPGLISAVQPIDTFHSIEGRPIYWLRISNNPTVDQPTKPQMLVTALHHAREPECLSATIYYLWYLLENYATDPHIKTIIDNTELYFVPCVNPDGYIYNITTNPGGGGLWRKNMRDNLDGTTGVDLNRNYGYEFAYDDVGSSPMTSSDTYRGTAGFSEPETQAVKWFTENHHFTLNLNYHTYNNDILFPWDYIASYQTVDSEFFFSCGSYLTQYNSYRYGTCNQTLGYIANGDSDDWMYGDTTTKPKVFGMTPEIGSNQEGFYPPTTSILPDCQDNLLSNINAASILLPFARINSSDEKILIQSSGYLHYDLQRLGFPDTATFSVSITPLGSWMTVSPTPKTYTGLALLQHVTDSISYNIIPATPNGQLISYVLNLYNGYYYMYDTVQFYYGKTYTVTTPSTESVSSWINNGWGVCSTVYYTPTASIVSNVTGCGNYFDNEDITISTGTPVDLTNSLEAWLQFYGQWAVESSYDYVMVEASVHGSGLWTPLCGKYTKPASVYQGIPGQPIYDGQQPNWVQEQIDLHDYLGSKVDIQFELISDAAVNYEGFYFDNLDIRTVEHNPTGVNNVLSNAASLSVYPNPATDELTIVVTGQSFSYPVTGVLYDCLGREAMMFALTDAKVTIDVHQLPENIYYLKLLNSEVNVPVQKVEIKR